MRRIAITLGLLSCLAACEDDLPPVTLITHMRVLGARSEVAGDPTRSNPKPGETARLSWSVGFPEFESNDEELASLFLSCTEPDRYTGVPVCQEIIDLASGKRPPGFGFDMMPKSCSVEPNSIQKVGNIDLICVTGTPALDVQVGKSIKTNRLVQGIICRNGMPQFDLSSPTGASCVRNDDVSDDEFESISVNGTITVDLEDADSDPNHNPSHELFELRIRADKAGQGRLWRPTPPDLLPALMEDCSAAPQGSIEINSGKTQVIEIGYPRDQLEDEDLTFSTYTTLGELSRRFTIIEYVQTEETAETPDLTWQLSEEQRDELLDKPTLVRFYFTVTDGRGGFDVTTRELCMARE